MVEDEPAFGCLYGHRSGTNLGALPCAVGECCGLHYQTVLSPKLHIGRLAQPDVSERRMSTVGRTAEHHVVAVDLFGEENTIAVEGQESIFHLEELLEVESVAYTDGGATSETIAPRDPVTVFNPYAAGVVFIEVFCHDRVATGCGLEYDGFVVDFPVYAILRESCEDVHLHAFVIAAENTGECITKTYYGAVEDAVAAGDGIAVDNWIFRISPYHVGTSGGAILPRNRLHNR